MLEAFILIWFVAAPVFGTLWIVSRKKLKKTRGELSACNEVAAPYLSEEKSLAETRAERAALERDMQEKRDILEADIQEVRTTYKEKRALLDALTQELAIADERVAMLDLGVYEPHFDFGDSEIFKDQIREVRAQQKAMISAKTAATCPQEWTVDGSKAKGKTMMNRQTKLRLRGFNNECEAAISNVRWNNVTTMEKRIARAVKAIDDANASMQLTLSPEYVTLKFHELFLTHEYREQLKVEKEERAETLRLEREEKKLLADAAKAEKEEKRYQALLEKARKEAGADSGKIEELEAALAEAHAQAERVRAMAEMTKSGYVYIISNVGSFGEDVVKIGLTRRLEPDDRVKELGDASVPFGFDTHAMIYSDEAPALEKALHRRFDERRVNMSNMRKEFFKVSLEEVETALMELSPDAIFLKDREAQEWHETMERRKALLRSEGAIDEAGQAATSPLPMEI